MNLTCLNEDEISDFRNWKGTFSTHPRWDHIASCATCSRRIGETVQTWDATSFQTVETESSGRSLRPQYVPPMDEIEEYRLLGFLGRGTHGEVWLAEELGVGTFVAIKFLDRSASPEVRLRLKREARVLGSFHHPSLLRILGFGSNEQTSWLVLEYCSGGSLADGRRNGARVSPQEAATILLRIAEGVSFAHSKGVIHRDIKPENILFCQFGQPRLADFGLAKVFDASVQLTATRDILGTPAYIAPEQVRGEKVGPAADIHALGGVLYHMLAGFAPYRADSAAQAFAFAENMVPLSPLKIYPDLPEGLVNICLKCLEKDPRDRYATAVDLQLDLRAFLRGSVVQARPLGPVKKAFRWSEKNKVAACALAFAACSLLVGTVTTTWMAYRAMDGEAEAKLSSERARMSTKEAKYSALRAEKLKYNSEIRAVQVAHDLGSLGSARRSLASLLPDPGQNDYRGFEWHFWHRKLQPGTDESELGLTEIRALSPQAPGRFLVIDWRNNLSVFDRKLGKAIPITTDSGLKITALDPKGRFGLVVDTRGKGVLVDCSADTPDFPQRPIGPMGYLSLAHIVLGPGARRALLIPSSTLKPMVYWDLETNRPIRELGPAPEYLRAPNFDPEGKRLAFALREGCMAVLNCEDGKMVKSPHMGGSLYRPYAWDPQGKSIAAVGVDDQQRQKLILWTPEKEVKTLEWIQNNVIIHPVFAPDGTLGISNEMSGISFFDRNLSLIHSTPGTGNMPVVSLPHDNGILVIDSQGFAKQFVPGKDITQKKNRPVRSIISMAWMTGERLFLSGTMDIAEFRNHPFDEAVSVPLNLNGYEIHSDSDQPGRLFVAAGQKLLKLDGDGKIHAEREIPKINFGICARSGKLFVRSTTESPLILDGDTLQTICSLPESGEDFCLSPNGTRAVLLGSKGVIKIYRTSDGKKLESFEVGGADPAKVVMDVNGTVFVGFNNGLIRAFPEENREGGMIAFKAHQNRIMALDVSPDGMRLASGAMDGSLKIWDTKTGQDLLTQTLLGQSHIRVRFNPDGDRLACLTNRGWVEVFDGRSHPAK